MYVGLLEIYWDLKVCFSVLLNTICVHCYDLRTLAVVTPGVSGFWVISQPTGLGLFFGFKYALHVAFGKSFTHQLL